MHTRHQNKIKGFGRRKVKSSTVTMMFIASAPLRMSVQCENGAPGENRNETGNSEGKPIESKPWAENGRKLLKFATRLTVPQPPTESLTRPLRSQLHQRKGLVSGMVLTLAPLPRRWSCHSDMFYPRPLLQRSTAQRQPVHRQLCEDLIASCWNIGQDSGNRRLYWSQKARSRRRLDRNPHFVTNMLTCSRRMRRRGRGKTVCERRTRGRWCR